MENRFEPDPIQEIYAEFAEVFKSSDFVRTDGGRAASGRRGSAGDCVCRAIALATGKPYDEIYRDLAQANKAAGGKASARNGLKRKVYEQYLNELGWTWHSAPKFDGRKARHSDMPEGVVIARMARHLACVIDGVIYDAWDSRRKMIYGYWAKAQS